MDEQLKSKPTDNQEKNYSSQWKTIFGFILELLKIIIISLAIIIPFRAYVAQPFYVEGASMEPTFYDKDYLIIDEISYRFEQPNRFDVVIFRPNNNYQVYYIKRVIGLPGETIEIKDGRVIIYNQTNPNGFILDENSYLNSSSFITNNDIKVTLGADQYYVMGDNRNNSLDSRRIGPIEIYQIKGRVFLRAYPFNQLTVF